MFKTVQICPQLSLVFPLIVPCLFSLTAGLEASPGLLKPCSHWPHQLPLLLTHSTTSHLGARQGLGCSRVPSGSHTWPGPTSIGMHKVAGWKEDTVIPEVWVVSAGDGTHIVFTLRRFSFPFDPLQFMKNRTHMFLITFYKITEMLTF